MMAPTLRQILGVVLGVVVLTAVCAGDGVDFCGEMVDITEFNGGKIFFFFDFFCDFFFIVANRLCGLDREWKILKPNSDQICV